MDREGFRNRMKQYKKAREENPGLKYWEWKDIPKYGGGTSNVTYDPIELRRNIQRVLNTTPEGTVNPFYNSLDDTYGSVLLPEVTVTAPYTRKASLAQQAKRGAKAYYDAGKKAAPLLATIPLSAGILGTASTLGWGTAMDLIDIATNPTDPLSYIDKFDIATFKKVDPMSKNAKPVSDKIFVDDAKVAGSTTIKPTYLDYGAVSFEDNILNERPLWVKDVLEFYDTDVMTRERNAASTAGVFYNLPFAEKRSKLTFNSERPVYVREYLDNVDFGGYANKDMVVIDKNSPFSPDEVLVHEGAHLDQYNGKELPFDLMEDFDIRETISNFVNNTYNDPKYKSFLLGKLDNAYEFTEDFGNIHSTLEKGATNREMRYNLWLKNNKPNVSELDNIINKMSDDDIIYMLTQTNSYSRDVHKNLLEKGKDKKDVAARIRKALKTVPILSTPIVLNFENDPQSSYAEGGEVGDEYFGNEVSTEDNPIYYKEQTEKEKYSDFVNKHGWTNIAARNARTAEASKYTIPYIPEKEIRLTTDRYNTGKISTNLLDSIYDSSQRVGIPFDVALGLAGRESTLGIGRGFKEGSDVTMTDLYSNWLLVQPVIASKSMTDKWNNLVRKEKRGEPLTDDDYAFRTEFLEFHKKALESTRPIKEHPIDNALKLYLTGRYNAGDKSYEQKVQKDARLLMSDPAIQKWAKEKGIALAEGGEVQPDPLEVLGRSRPKIAGIPINDKPLSGTDPLGELYLNYVSGKGVYKTIKGMKAGFDRKSLKSAYDYYHNDLRFPRKMAYDVAKARPYAVEGIDNLLNKFIELLKWN